MCAERDTGGVTIRPYAPADRVAIRALHDRTPPAGSAADGPQPWPPDLDRIPQRYLAFWVAVETGAANEQVVGMVGVSAPDPALPSPVLRDRANVVQLKRMRVAPERQRRGIGARLTQTVVAWARDHGAEAVILETTAQQTAAIDLYRRLGFREVGRSMAGGYELVWFELALNLLGLTLSVPTRGTSPRRAGRTSGGVRSPQGEVRRGGPDLPTRCAPTSCLRVRPSVGDRVLVATV